MGKYDSILATLKPMPVEDLRRQEKIDEVKSEIAVDKETGEIVTFTPEMLSAMYVRARAIDDRIEAERYALHLQIEALEQMLVVSWDRQEEGWGTFGASPNTIRTRDNFAIDVDPQPRGKVVDPEAYRLWCIASPDVCMTCGGAADALGHQETDEVDPADPHPFTKHPFKPGGGMEKKMTLLWQTTNSIAKQRAQAGAPPPDGVEVYAHYGVKFRKI